MITVEEYLQDPCGTLSIPYWKWIRMELPKNVQIRHHRDIEPGEANAGERYFRLRHDLKDISDVDDDRYEVVTATREDFETICHVINSSYPNMTMTCSRLTELTKTPVCDPGLWVLARERKTGNVAGCAIGDLDQNCREGILEWVQVLPEYRRQGVGTLMVIHLLRTMAEIADFATVSGRCDNESEPEQLYRKCGFAGGDIWHIMRK